MLFFYRRTLYALPRSYKRVPFALFPTRFRRRGCCPEETPGLAALGLRRLHREAPAVEPPPGLHGAGLPAVFPASPRPPFRTPPARRPTKPLTSPHPAPRSAPPFSGRRRLMEPGKDPGAASSRRCGLGPRPRPLPFLRGWPRRGPALSALAAPLRTVPLLRHNAVAPRSAGSAPMRAAGRRWCGIAPGGLSFNLPPHPSLYFPPLPPFSLLSPPFSPPISLLLPPFPPLFPLSLSIFAHFFPFYIIFIFFSFSSLPPFFLPFPVSLFFFHSIPFFLFFFFFPFFPFYFFPIFSFSSFFLPFLPFFSLIFHTFPLPFFHLFHLPSPTAPPFPAPFSFLSPASPLPLIPAAAPPDAAGAVCPRR